MRYCTTTRCEGEAMIVDAAPSLEFESQADLIEYECTYCRSTQKSSMSLMCRKDKKPMKPICVNCGKLVFLQSGPFCKKCYSKCL